MSYLNILEEVSGEKKKVMLVQKEKQRLTYGNYFLIFGGVLKWKVGLLDVSEFPLNFW